MQNVLAKISLSTIRENAKKIVDYAGKPLIAVVKDDGYGHGAQAVAGALHGIAAGFAVATVWEGAALRHGGVTEEILVLTPCLDTEDALRCCRYKLTACVSSRASLNVLLRAKEEYGCNFGVHFAVNTGMNRYGLRPELLRDCLMRAAQAGIDGRGIYSHYFMAENDGLRARQLAVFTQAAKTARSYFPDCVRHIAATGGVLAGGELFDCVRVGLALYGYLPAAYAGRLDVKPAMKLYASVAQAGTFTGGGVGYQPAQKNYKKLHTLRLGYGDGFFRSGGLGVGKLCMDSCIREGRGEFGRKKCVLKDVSAYAHARGTTEYEALVRLTQKAVRIYDGC